MGGMWRADDAAHSQMEQGGASHRHYHVQLPHGYALRSRDVVLSSISPSDSPRAWGDDAAKYRHPRPHHAPHHGADGQLRIHQRGPPPDDGLPRRLREIAAEAWSRGRWLVGLMAAQSLSSVILDRYSDLLREHLVITLFLTMLVGAGGNAGNQSSIKVIRGLATGALDTSDACIRATLAEQAAVGVLLGGALSAAGFARVFLTNGSLANSSAIALSVLGIVSSSCLLGSGLPFVLARAGLDPANAGTSIQVVMDILGVAITCATCDVVLRQLAGSVGVGVAARAGGSPI